MKSKLLVLLSLFLVKISTAAPVALKSGSHHSITVTKLPDDTVDPTLYAYAQNAPADIAQDIDRLVQYLKVPAKTDKELVQVFSYWIMEHISYDVYGFLNGVYNKNGFAGTLNTRRAVCQDYSELFKAMCDRANIKCYVVTGYAKGLGYNPSNTFNKINHAWNVVLLNDDYSLIDLTWASGYVGYDSGSLKFFKKMDATELFVKPEVFVDRHLPANPQWQLLNYPVSMRSFLKYDQFEKMPRDSSYSYNYKDSIGTAGKLDQYEQEIKLAERAYKFFPLSEDLSYHYYNVAVNYCITASKLSTAAAYNEPDQLSAIELYKKAIKLFNRVEKLPSGQYTSLSVDAIAGSNQNIVYANYRLSNKQ